MSYSKNGYLATGSGGGGGGAVVAAPVSVPAPVTGSSWVLLGVANYPDASTLNLTTNVGSVSGYAWYPTPVTLDGLYVGFDGTFAIDALRLNLGDPATDTTASANNGHGIQIAWETWYQANRPVPDNGTQGAYAAISWTGSGVSAFTSSVGQHVVDSTMNLSTTGSQFGPARIELFVKATALANMYHYSVFKDGSPYMETILPGPVGGKALLGFGGSTGGSSGINSVKNFVAYTGLVENLTSASTLEVVSTANSGTAYTIPDVGTSTISNVTLTGNCVFTFPAANSGKSFTLALTQDATGSRTATWPGTVKWPNAVSPTLSTAVGKTDLLTFVCIDGTNWLGSFAGKF